MGPLQSTSCSAVFGAHQIHNSRPFLRHRPPQHFCRECDDNKSKYPEEVLEKLGIECTEASFASWVFPSLPKIHITHFPTWKVLQACHPYRDDRAGWKAFVAANLHLPEYPAFDYSADFHMSDLSPPEKGGIDYGEIEITELLPLGKGWQYQYGFSTSEFVRSSTENAAHFTKYPKD